MNGDGTVLVDDFVDAALGLLERAGIHGAAFHIDGGAFRAHVEAHGLEVEQLFEDGGEQVLAGVLLHVVEAAAPVDDAGGGAGGDQGIGGRGEVVGDAIALIDDVEDGDAAEGAGVEGLAAGGGVEGRAVEVGDAAIGGGFEDQRGKIAQVGIGVIETVGHGDIAIVPWGQDSRFSRCAMPRLFATM